MWKDMVIALCICFIAERAEAGMITIPWTMQSHWKTMTTGDYNINTILELDPLELILSKSQLLILTFELGTPKQVFSCLIDTGSFLLWVARKDTSISATHFYDPTTSSTFKNLYRAFSVTYITGVTKGFIAEDVISLHTENLTPIQFGVATQSNFQAIGIDGIFGLGRDYNNASITEKDQSLIYKLKNKQIITNSVFSIQPILTDKAVQSFNLYIGEYHSEFNKNNFDKYTWGECNIQKTNWLWACKLRYIVFGTLDESNSNFKAISHEATTNVVIDSGTNTIILPNSFLSTFTKQLSPYGCAPYTEQGYQFIVCDEINSFPDLSFVINGYVYKIKKQNVFVYVEKAQKFMLTIYFKADLNFALLGSPFFKQYHILFDQDKDKIMFYTEEGVKNVRDYTTDDDFILWDYSFYISLAIVLGIMILFVAGVWIYWWKQKKMGEELINHNFERLV